MSSRAERAYWDTSHRQGLKGKAGEQEAARSAATEEPGPSSSPTPGKAGAPPARLYPAGKPLTGEEARQSLQHAPTDSKGVVKCWGACTWAGCRKKASECSRSHLEPIRNLDSCHYTVQMQLIRRGGLKARPRIELKNIDGRVQQLRAAAEQEGAAKKADGQARAKSKAGRDGGQGRRRSGWPASSPGSARRRGHQMPREPRWKPPSVEATRGVSSS